LKYLTSLHELEKITAGDKALLKELLTIFIQEASVQIEKMQNSLDTGNIQELKHVAHKVKSSVTLIGMNTYRAIAEKIEMEGEKDPGKTRQEAIGLISAYTRALAELKIKLEEIS
jgi:HPt (histidine-containing phosphotransfer) domain-containing protein